MDNAAVELLICPHCEGELRENGASLICSRGHTMNIARQGYVSLLSRDAGTHTADSAGMIAARERFLGAGHFQPLVEALVEAAAGTGEMAAGKGEPEPETGEADATGEPKSETGEADATGEPQPEPGETNTAGERRSGGAVVDFGCGTGHYLAAVLEALPDRVGIGVDNSKFAARRAARCHPRASAIVADIWDGVPVRDGAANLMLNVFSPRNGEEMERILATGGRLIVVTPQAGHLAELIDPFGMVSVDPDKDERLERSLGSLAEGAESRNLEWTMQLTPGEIRDLIEMGPSAGRIAAEQMDAALADLEDQTAVTGAVTLTVSRRPIE